MDVPESWPIACKLFARTLMHDCKLWNLQW
jgi:hypothetical protein